MNQTAEGENVMNMTWQMQYTQSEAEAHRLAEQGYEPYAVRGMLSGETRYYFRRLVVKKVEPEWTVTPPVDWAVKVRQDTLKEVGAWLRQRTSDAWTPIYPDQLEDQLAALERGEMPK